MKLSDTIARLAALKMGGIDESSAAMSGRLAELGPFGADPGNLRALIHVPQQLPERPALVVVLHGCTQSAAAYDAGAGWSRLADEQGFVVLFPEQRRANNPNLCFNWFSPGDTRRDGGEALSIRQMIATVVARHGVDPARIFITGLSAGGAMTSVMLATYPEVFAGGAIVAGLPYSCAQNVSEALDRMRGHRIPAPAELGSLVRGASAYDGAWPTISIWHGSKDMTVDVSNAAAILAQWRAVHELGEAPSETGTVDGQAHRIWRNAAGRAVIEEYRIAGLGHGTPLDAAGTKGRERPGPFMLEAGISSTTHIAGFWGLTATAERAGRDAECAPPATAGANPAGHVLPAIRAAARVIDPSAAKPGTAAMGVGKVIEDALRTAGLMR